MRSLDLGVRGLDDFNKCISCSLYNNEVSCANGRRFGKKLDTATLTIIPRKIEFLMEQRARNAPDDTNQQ